MLNELLSCLVLLIVGPALGFVVFCVLVGCAAIAQGFSDSASTVLVTVAYSVGVFIGIAGIIKAFIIFMGVVR